MQTTEAELAEDRAERVETVAALATSEVVGAARAAAPDRAEQVRGPSGPLETVGTATRTDPPPSQAGQDGARPADDDPTPPPLAGWSTEWSDTTPPVPAARHRTRNRVLAAVAVLLVLAASVSYVLSLARNPQSTDIDASAAAPPLTRGAAAARAGSRGVPQAIAASVPIPAVRRTGRGRKDSGLRRDRTERQVRLHRQPRRRCRDRRRHRDRPGRRHDPHPGRPPAVPGVRPRRRNVST